MLLISTYKKKVLNYAILTKHQSFWGLCYLNVQQMHVGTSVTIDCNFSQYQRLCCSQLMSPLSFSATYHLIENINDEVK